jgi:hypothetical protein
VTLARASNCAGMQAPLPLITPAPSPQEAAAIVAALECFRRDTAAPPPRRPAGVGGWLRAARLEAVRSEPEALAPWGDSRPWRAAADPRSSNP